MTDEHFLVWMRPSPLSNFTKFIFIFFRIIIIISSSFLIFIYLTIISIIIYKDNGNKDLLEKMKTFGMNFDIYKMNNQNQVEKIKYSGLNVFRAILSTRHKEDLYPVVKDSLGMVSQILIDNNYPYIHLKTFYSYL